MLAAKSVLVILLFYFIGLVLGRNVYNYNDNSNRIVGGYEVKIEEHPYQVAMYHYGIHNYKCGGSIIRPNFILTAAHCVYGMDTEDVQIRAGSNDNTKGGVVKNVKKLFIHPLYNRTSFESDVAILLLTNSLKYSRKIKPIKLEVSNVPDGTAVITSGWGRNSTNGEYPTILNAVKLVIANHGECVKAFTDRTVTEQMICAIPPPNQIGKDACAGDSGGPLAHDKLLVGIVSWGKGCANGNPGVYTNVAKFHNWIEKILSTNS